MKTRIALLAAALVTCSQAHAITLLNDDFTSGTNPGWTVAGGGATLTVETDAGIGSGNALKFNSSVDNRQMVRGFQSVTLGIGDTITLTADYRFTSTPNDSNNSFLFYFGNTAIGSEVGSLFNPGHVATNNDGVFRRNPADSNEGKFNSFNHGTTAQQITLVLTRSAADELSFDLSWAGNPAGPYSRSSSAAVASDYFTYDQIEVGFLNSQMGEFYLDNVSVQSTGVVPEPASVAGLLALVVLGFATYRRRMRR